MAEVAQITGFLQDGGMGSNAQIKLISEKH